MTPFLILLVLILLNLIVIAVGIFFILEVIGAVIAPVPFVPVPRSVVAAIMNLLPLEHGGTLYDLGSGDGRVVFAAAHQYPQATAIGVEKAPLPFLLAWWHAHIHAHTNARTLRQDLFKTSLSNASVVFMYLMPNVLERLYPKLVKELAKGTPVISCDFTFKDREVSHIIPVLNGKKRSHTLYVYEF